jgi:hypothetical protein
MEASGAAVRRHAELTDNGAYQVKATRCYSGVGASSEAAGGSQDQRQTHMPDRACSRS